jgi:hypothetical protein
MPATAALTPLSPRSISRPSSAANVGTLIGVALAFLLLGVGLALVLMKFVLR